MVSLRLWDNEYTNRRTAKRYTNQQLRRRPTSTYDFNIEQLKRRTDYIQHTPVWSAIGSNDSGKRLVDSDRIRWIVTVLSSCVLTLRVANAAAVVGASGGITVEHAVEWMSWLLRLRPTIGVVDEYGSWNGGLWGYSKTQARSDDPRWPLSELIDAFGVRFIWRLDTGRTGKRTDGQMIRRSDKHHPTDSNDSSDNNGQQLWHEHEVSNCRN